MDGTLSKTTDLSGAYTFSTTVPGTHAILERDPPGYDSTTPNIVTLNVSLGQSYQVDFGDRQSSSCSCPPDKYEDDDSSALAAGLAVGETQPHNFCDDSTDWITFTAEAGNLYTMTTSAWGQRTDTFLSLFDTNAQTLLAANDDCAGGTDYSSCIAWQAPASGIYYLRTTNRVGLNGCQTDYTLWIEVDPRFRVFLPSVMQRYSQGTGTREAQLYPTGVISHTCPDTHEIDGTW